MQLNVKADNKTKSQVLKKILSFVKKNKNDEAKLSSFYVKLSAQIQEKPANISQWIEYESVKGKIESLQLVITKEVSKFIHLISTLKLKIDTPEFTDINVRLSKEAITNRLKDFMKAAKEEETMLKNNPTLMRLIEDLSPNKTKKKTLSAKDRIIK